MTTADPSDHPPPSLHLQIVTAADAGQPGYDALLSAVLELQHLVAWRPGMTAQERTRGFLATTWSLPDLHALMAEGAYFAAATDSLTGQLRGYSLMAHIRHLPPGDFIPAPDSPVRSRTGFFDETRFVYGYQLAVRPEPAPHRFVGAAVLSAIASENARRSINAVNCVLEAPVCNTRSLEFLSAMGISRIGTIHDPRGPALLQEPVTWACLVRLPLRTPRTSTLKWTPQPLT